MAIQLGTKIKQIINDNYRAIYVDDLRSMLRAFDQFGGTITVIDTTINDPNDIIDPLNGDAYYSGAGAVDPFQPHSINVWRTGMTDGVANTPLSPQWESYPVIEGWLIVSQGVVYKVKSDLTLENWEGNPFDQVLNTDSTVLFNRIKTSEIDISGTFISIDGYSGSGSAGLYLKDSSGGYSQLYSYAIDKQRGALSLDTGIGFIIRAKQQIWDMGGSVDEIASISGVEEFNLVDTLTVGAPLADATFKNVYAENLAIAEIQVKAMNFCDWELSSPPAIDDNTGLVFYVNGTGSGAWSAFSDQLIIGDDNLWYAFEFPIENEDILVVANSVYFGGIINSNLISNSIYRWVDGSPVFVSTPSSSDDRVFVKQDDGTQDSLSTYIFQPEDYYWGLVSAQIQRWNLGKTLYLGMAGAYQYIEAIIANTTNAGLVPAIPNDATKFFNGAGGYSSPKTFSFVGVKNNLATSSGVYTWSSGAIPNGVTKFKISFTELQADNASGNLTIGLRLVTNAGVLDGAGRYTVACGETMSGVASMTTASYMPISATPTQDNYFQSNVINFERSAEFVGSDYVWFVSGTSLVITNGGVFVGQAYFSGYIYVPVDEYPVGFMLKTNNASNNIDDGNATIYAGDM